MTDVPVAYRDAPRWPFGDSPELADELLALVIAGGKKATCSSLASCEADIMPTVGEVSVILDGAGVPRCAIRTTEVEIMPFEEVSEDYRTLFLSLKGHPLAFLRDELAANGSLPAQALARARDKSLISVAGLVLVRQRPQTASGVIFMTLEDETGIANAIVWPKAFERFRPVVLGARLTAISGREQAASGVIHVVAETIEDLTPLLSVLADDADDLKSLARADEAGRDSYDPREGLARHPRMVRFFQKPPDAAKQVAEASAKVMPKGRNFH